METNWVKWDLESLGVMTIDDSRWNDGRGMGAGFEGVCLAGN